MERLSSNPEREASSPSGSGLSRYGRVLTDVQIVIDLEEMFGKSNYPAFLAQSLASEMSGWTGVPLTVDEPIGEFAACVAINNKPHEINLALAGKFSSMWGSPDLLLIVTNEDEKRLLFPSINEDEKLFFLIHSAKPQKPHESVLVPMMAVMEAWYSYDFKVPPSNVAYTLLLNAYLSTLL